jgi:MFS family permease
MKTQPMPKQKPTFNLLFSIIALDNIASAIILPVLMYILYPCQAEQACRNIGISDSAVFLSGVIFLLSPSYIFASPAIGRLADLYGRKFALRICLILSIAGYLLLLIANSQQNIVLALTAVLLLNAGSCSMTVVQAAATDISKGRHKAYLFGLITFILMPLYLIVAQFGGLLLDLSRTYAYIRDYIIMLSWLISIGNLLMLYYYQEPKDYPPRQTHVQQLNISDSATIFSRPIIILLVLFTLFEFAASGYFEIMVNIATDKAYFTFNGFPAFLYYKFIIMIISICFIYPLLIKHYTAYQLLTMSLTLCSISVFASILLPVAMAQWFLITCFTLGEMIFVPIVWYLLSEMTHANNQGLIMGIKGTLWSLAWSLGLIIGNKLHNILPETAAVFLVVILMLSSRWLAKYVHSVK